MTEELDRGIPRILRSLEIMDRLRRPGGDAWSAAQTHQSLSRYLLEETHEVLDVIEDPGAHPHPALVDELGDLLFQILFHARIGEEEDPSWGFEDVAAAFVAKMERRNPHVFGEDPSSALEEPGDVEAIVAQWHAVKARERAERAGDDSGARPAHSEHFGSLPAGLPALQTAAKAVHRSRSAGDLSQLLRAADEVVGEDDAPEGADLARVLLDWVVAAEARDIDPESALRSLLRRVDRRLLEREEAGEDTDPSETIATHRGTTP